MPIFALKQFKGLTCLTSLTGHTVSRYLPAQRVKLVKPVKLVKLLRMLKQLAWGISVIFHPLLIPSYMLLLLLMINQEFEFGRKAMAPDYPSPNW